MIFLLLLFETSFIPNLKFLAYAYRVLSPAGKNGPGRVRKSPVINRVNINCIR